MYGLKLHACMCPLRHILQSPIRSAKLHDTTVAYELNRRWPDFGGPTIVGDQEYCCLGFAYQLKRNARHESGWRLERHPLLRHRVETVFAQLVEAQIRSVQLKTIRSLRLRVVLAVLVHNPCLP